MEHHQTPEKNYNLERLIFFSDGVFAIVITLLVLELRIPQHWDRTLASLWREEWRSISAFAISFAAVGAFWNAHRLLFAQIERFHGALVFLNFLLLGGITLLPFAATLIYETGPRGEPFAIYVGLIAVIAVMQALLWGFAAFIGKVIPARISLSHRVVVFASMLIMPLLIVILALLVGADRPVSEWIWFLPALIGLGLLRRRLTRNSGAAQRA